MARGALAAPGEVPHSLPKTLLFWVETQGLVQEVGCQCPCVWHTYVLKV
jgi:hypothetical protein